MEKFIKASVRDFKEYKVDTNQYEIRVDANENAYNIYELLYDKIEAEFRKIPANRYPDTDSVKLREAISKFIDLDIKNIIVGNGSDELIQLIFNTFLDKDEIIVTHTPSFAMYKIFANVFNAKAIEVPSNDDFEVDIDGIIEASKDDKVKLVILCTPNNPTGNIVKSEDIIKVLENTDKIVIVDEAYVEFGGESAAQLIKKYDRLIILRTLSKAFALAGARVGYMLANEKMINILNKVKSPYNLNAFSQTIATVFFENIQVVDEYLKRIMTQKEFLYNELKQIDGLKVFESHANFIMIKSLNNVDLGLLFKSQGVSIRVFGDGALKNHARITVGTEAENKRVLDIIKKGA